VPFLLRCAGLAAVLLFMSAVSPATPSARAHPFGEPQTVTLERDRTDGHVLRVVWKAGATDDLALLQRFLGLAPGYPTETNVSLLEAARASRALATEPEFRDYLLSHIALTVEGRTCRGAVGPIDSLTADGASLEFSCPRPVSAATLVVRMLTDLHPAYRTFAIGPDGQRAVYDLNHDAHEWSTSSAPGAPTPELAGATPSVGTSAALQLSATAGTMAAVAGGCWLWLRRRAGRTQTA
jgi:hypothetical protein